MGWVLHFIVCMWLSVQGPMKTSEGPMKTTEGPMKTTG